MLSLVTASHCNPSGLAALYRQFGHRLGPDLHWAIQDSGACPTTRSWGNGLENPFVSVACEPDSGIYEALNRAIDRLTTPYYLVVGSDDALDVEALEQITESLARLGAGGPDILTYPVRVGGRIRRRNPWWPTSVNVLGLTASHSVGTVIRRSLHDRLGPYDPIYRILADSLFLRKAHQSGVRFEHRDGPVPGEFATGGISSTRLGRLLIECYTYNVACGSSKTVQSLLALIRLLVYRPGSLL